MKKERLLPRVSMNICSHRLYMPLDIKQTGGEKRHILLPDHYHINATIWFFILRPHKLTVFFTIWGYKFTGTLLF